MFLMAEKKNNQLESLKAFFKRIPLKQKLYLLLGAILTLVAILVVVSIVSSVNYGILFSNLSEKDSGLIIAQLKERNIPYKLNSNASIIKIPQDRIPELRIELAAEGLPEGSGVGFEIFDETSLTSNDFTQRINYIRAKEGELGRSIASLEEITAAKVHISVPDESVFIEERQEAKASVVVKLKPGAYLSRSIIPAISHLVAQAVKGLEIENIAVIDVNGKLLSEPMQKEQSAFDSISAKQMSYERKMEEQYRSRIIDLLAPLVGSGGLSVNVDLDMNFDKRESKQEIVNPDETVKVSEQIETSSSRGTTSGGVPGVASNVAQAAGAGQPENSNTTESDSEKTTTNYEVSKTVTHSVKQVGEIRRVSAAVILGNKVESSVVEDELVRESVPWSSDEIANINRLVRASIGYSTERGDVVEVVNAPFDDSMRVEVDLAQQFQKKQDFMDQLMKYGSMLLAGLLIFFLILRPFFKRSGDIVRSALSGQKTKQIQEAKMEKEMAKLKETEEEEALLEEMNRKFKTPRSTKKKEIMLEKVKEFTGDKTDEAVSVMRTIMNEE